MYKIEGLTEDTNQSINIILEDGTTVTLKISFVPMQYGWFIKSMTYKEFTLNNFRLVTSINMLNQYRNRIPFGIGCITRDNLEPKLQQDFSSGYAALYILNKDELSEYQRFLSAKV